MKKKNFKMNNNIKKFEDFLDRMQGLLDNAKKEGDIIVRVEDLEKTFPELKESEDERIRKELISFLQLSHPQFVGERNQEKWIAWLEKQDEQKPAVDTKVIIPKFRVGVILKSKSQPILRPRKIVSIDKERYWCEDGGCIDFALEDDYEIVEPKFHGGDWNEVDEHLLIETIQHLEELIRIDKAKHCACDVQFYQRDIDWLKSIKLRMNNN